MERVYLGKTKDVYALGNGQLLLRFKDEVTGENGVFDPGANMVGLTIDGMGRANLAMSVYYFKLLNGAGVPTHFLDADLGEGSMTVLSARPFGKGLEVICRKRAVGSFIRRYGAYLAPGDPLDDYVEFTLKDDGRGDPLINNDGLIALRIMDAEQIEQVSRETRRVTNLIAGDLSSKGLELYDIKLEFGLVGEDIVLMDEISSGNMRVMDEGRPVEPLALTRRVLGEV